MSTAFAQVRPTTPPTISLEFAVVCLFPLLGLALSAAVLSCVSNETIGMMFASIG